MATTTLQHPVTRVEDGAAFTSAVQQIVGGFGSVSEAARELGVRRSRLSQLHRGRVGRWIRTAVLARLQHRAPPAAARLLEQAVFSPAAHGRFRVYRGWLDQSPDRRARGLEADLLTWGKHGVPGLKGAARRASKSAALEAVSELRAFREIQRRRGHDAVRIHRAIFRALAPLCAAQETAGIERGAAELAQEAAAQAGPRRSQLAAYLHFALRAEAILLDRAPDRQRAQEMARG